MIGKNMSNYLRRLAQTTALATPIVVGIAQSSEAVLIQHNAGTVFFDDFESAPEVETNLSAPTVDADPVAITGTWTPEPNPTDGITSIQVTNHAAHHGAAAQGNNYLYLRPNAQDGTVPAVRAQLGTLTGGTVHFEAMYRNNDLPGGTSEIQFTFFNGASLAFPIIRGDSAGNFIGFDTAFNVQDTGLNVPQDANWHKVEINANLATGAYQFFLDGVAGAALNSGATNQTVTTFKMGPAGFTTANESQTFDLDAVIPEPASLGLVGFGAAMAMARRRSKTM